MTGCFVLYDPSERRYLVHNAARVETRYLPASTFKIANSLIALETGVLADTSVVFPWDGTERSIATWNRDHAMTTAFRYSVVWYYQAVAREIGTARMQTWLERIGYGNHDISGGIDLFWLSGGLRISALEQVDFLARLYEGNLPFAPQTMASVRGLMVEEATATPLVRAKTGWTTATNTGWYVGYVEQGDRVWYFALNMDMETAEQAPLRRDLTHHILRDMGIL